jgi:hypothetical protein
LVAIDASIAIIVDVPAGVDDLYREYGKLGETHAGVKALARRLGREPSAVAAEMNNLHHGHSEPGVYPKKRRCRAAALRVLRSLLHEARRGTC